MGLDTASQLLLLIVSATLSLFLVVSIVVLVKVLQVLNSLKHITEKAERLADSAEAVGDFFRKSAGPVALAKLLASVVESAVKHKKKEE